MKNDQQTMSILITSCGGTAIENHFFPSHFWQLLCLVSQLLNELLDFNEVDTNCSLFLSSLFWSYKNLESTKKKQSYCLLISDRIYLHRTVLRAQEPFLYESFIYDLANGGRMKAETSADECVRLSLLSESDNGTPIQPKRSDLLFPSYKE